jgi:hypothetical protein
MTGGVSQGPSDDLKESVVGFYESMKSYDYVRAWDYERMSTEEDPERRENMRSTYLARIGGFQLKEYEIIEIGEEGGGAKGFTAVKMKFTSKWPVLPIPMPEGDRVWYDDDLWEKIGGKWYHVRKGITRFW